jgi:uncharacterized protein (DUF1499 family)
MGLADIINGAGGLLSGSSPALFSGGRRGGKSTMAIPNQDNLISARMKERQEHELDPLRYALQQQQAQQPHTLTPSLNSGSAYTWSPQATSTNIYEEYLDDSVKEKKRKYKSDVDRVIDEEVNRIRNL